MIEQKVSLLRRTTFHCGSFQKSIIKQLLKKNNSTLKELTAKFGIETPDAIQRLQKRNILSVS
jgi:hypothetical protein